MTLTPTGQASYSSNAQKNSLSPHLWICSFSPTLQSRPLPGRWQQGDTCVWWRIVQQIQVSCLFRAIKLRRWARTQTIIPLLNLLVGSLVPWLTSEDKSEVGRRSQAEHTVVRRACPYDVNQLNPNMNTELTHSALTMCTRLACARDLIMPEPNPDPKPVKTSPSLSLSLSCSLLT